MSKLYFCYSSSLDSEAFDVWKRNHGYTSFSLPTGDKVRAEGVKLAFNLFSNYWGGRVLGLESDPSGPGVEGLLFEISEEDWPIIEHKEGARTGLSTQLELRCRRADGSECRAVAFSTPEARRSAQGLRSPNFLETIKNAYKKWGLSADFDSIP